MLNAFEKIALCESNENRFGFHISILREDLFKQEDDPIDVVKDQVKLLYHELLFSNSPVHEMKQPLEIEELKEALMRIGGIAHQAEYLITSFLVKDAPLWYVLQRLTRLNRWIAPIRMELQLITHKYQFGGLKVGNHFSIGYCGLPLTVDVIASFLSNVNEEERTWGEVGGSLARYIGGEDNSVMQILELSYKHLSDHLKPCFLYFGEFKEDEAISAENLKRLWVAEGFERKDKDKSAESIAEEYLMELIDKNLVMIAKRRIDGRGAKSCVLHDLLSDLCLTKCKEESFLKYQNITSTLYLC